jgi:site-specific DNA-cytosine methylase
MMKVLVACEYSGRVRDAFTKKGHDAISCDILPTESDGPHYQGDVYALLNEPWDLVIAFPPCTHLASSGARWWPHKQADGRQAEAMQFFIDMLSANSPRIAVENPAGIMTKAYRAPDQYVEPFWFGEPYRKRTGLWLKNLPLLVPTEMVEPKAYWVGGDRGKYGLHRDPHKRSVTFQGLADAMASQWG